MTLVSGIQLPIDRIAETCQRYGVKELAVFGSASRGGMGPGSDVDMLVEFVPGVRVGIVKFASLEKELEDLIGHRVDLVTKQGLKPWIRQTVLSEAQVVFPA